MSYRILLVDDEPSIRVVLGAILEEAGYTVDVAEDGISALRKIESAVPDLLLTDLRMPNMNGFELLEIMRARLPHIPRVAISGEFLASDVEKAGTADLFFQKGNYSIVDFLASIRQLLSTRAAAAAEAAAIRGRAVAAAE